MVHEFHFLTDDFFRVERALLPLTVHEDFGNQAGRAELDCGAVRDRQFNENRKRPVMRC